MATTGPTPSSSPRGAVRSGLGGGAPRGGCGGGGRGGAGPGRDTPPSRSRDLGASYHLNLSSHFRWSALAVSVGLYTSLCQYFSEEHMAWRSEGLVPLEETSPREAVCLTRHLTAFGASLFVPASRIEFTFPVSGAAPARKGAQCRGARPRG